MKTTDFFKVMTLGSTLLALSACSSGGQNGSSDFTVATKSDASQFDQATTLCQPMLSGSGYTSIFANETAGLQGRLYTLAPANDGAFSQLSSYFTYGIDSGVDVFLDNVNIPTRYFTQGFPVANGTLLQANGAPVIEYFSMHLESYLQLGSSDAPGLYQLALLADDGAILSIKAPGNDDFSAFVNDDGTHPTTMACATSPLVLNSYDTVPMKLDYYQGPRYHIALTMMWRPWPTDGTANDPLCGASGNSEFFDWTQTPSAPTANYVALESRGWKPLTPSNFMIPNAGVNPCQVPGFNQAQ